MGAYNGPVAYLARTLRTLYECHMNHAPVCKNGYKKYTCTGGCIDGIIGLGWRYYTGIRLYSVHAVPGGAGAAFLCLTVICVWDIICLTREPLTSVHLAAGKMYSTKVAS